MAKRRFNWKFAIVLVLAFAVLGVTAYTLRKVNRSRRAATGLTDGNKAYLEGKWQDAASALGRYIAVVPDDVSALLKYAEAQLNIRPAKGNHIRQAISTYRQIRRIDKSNTEAIETLIAIYLQTNSAAEVEFIAREFLKNNDTPKMRRMLAIALVRQRKFSEALTELTGIIEKHPEDILAYQILGQLAQQRPEDITSAPEQWFNEAVKNNPESAHAHIVRASHYLRQNDQEKARADLARAEELGLSDPSVKLRLIQEYLNLNDLEKARPYLLQLQAEDPEDPALWQVWARLARRSGSTTEMLSVAHQGLEALSKKKWDFMPTAIDLLIQVGEYDQAADCIKQLRDIEMIPAVLAYYEGEIAYRKDQIYEAIKHWRTALELGNKASELRIMLADALYRTGSLHDALQQLQKLSADHPNSFQAHLKYAKLLTYAGKWKEAAEHTQLAQQINPRSHDAVLLSIQVKVQLLQQSGIDHADPQWKTIENGLTQLGRVAQDVLGVKLTAFQLAIILQQYEKAEALLLDMKNSDPSSMKVVLAQLELMQKQDKSEQIEPYLRQAIKDHPQSTTPVKSLAMFLSRQDKIAECEKVINDALARIEPSQAQRELGVLLANLYRRHGKKDMAYKTLVSLSRQLPQDISVKRQLISYEQISKNTAKIQEIIDTIKEMEGLDGWQWRYEQAKLWMNNDDFENMYSQVIALLTDNLRFNPDNNTSRMLLAAAYEKAGDSQLALSTYRQAYNLAPRDLTVIIPVVDAMNRAGQFNEASAILNRAAQQRIYHPVLSGLRFRNYIGLGEVDSGIDVLEDLSKSDPENQHIRLQIALLKMQQKKFDQAGVILGKLRWDNPDSLPALIALVDLRVKQNKPQEAIQLCNELLEKQDNSSAFLVRAQTYAAFRELDKAEADFKHAADIDSASIDVWIKLCNFYRSQGKHGSAVTAIENALSLQPTNLQAKRIIVSLLLGSRDPAELRRGNTILDETLAQYPDDLQLRLYKTQTLLAVATQPTIDQATDMLRSITQDHRESAAGWRMWGELVLQQGQPGKAMDLALRGLVASPNDKNLLLLKARCEGYRSPSLAIPTLKALLQLGPHDLDVTLLLARAYIAADDNEKAAALLQEKLAYCPDQDRRKLSITLAAARYGLGEKDQALKQLDSLFESDPDDAEPIMVQVRLLRDDRRWEELKTKALQLYDAYSKGGRLLIAISREIAASKDDGAKETAEQILRWLLTKETDNVEATEVLATLLQFLERPDESAQLYQKLIARTPDNVIAINNLAWILCEDQGEHQKALELTQQGLEQKPDYLDLIDTRGVVYYRLGEYEKAIGDFEKCVRMYRKQTPGIVGSYFHLARAQAQIGRKQDALENVKQALELNGRTGGLSQADVAEAQRLRDELSYGLKL